MYLQPMFYFPSTLVWLDDDPLFIQASLPALEKPHYPLKVFNHPHDCLVFFEHYSPPLSKMPFLRGSTHDEYYETLQHSPVDFNVLSIGNLAEYDKRHHEVSVLIIDFNMPDMNGLEVLQQLRHCPMKKILLTGETDYHNAVNAFNEGIIDRFVQKNSPTLFADLKQYVCLLNRQYFDELTQPLLAHLETERKIPLSDPIWIDFFQAWCRTNAIREYYLIDKTGSFLCINQQDEAFYFILHTENTLDAFVKTYEEDEELKSFVDSVKMREKIPFFGCGKEAWQFEAKNWEAHFYSAATLQGRELYHWHVISVK